MKNIKIYLPLLCLLLACGEHKKEKAPIATTEDSLDVYPPTPGKISKKEFRRYYSTAKGFFDSGLIKRGFNGSVLVAKNGVPVLEEYVGFTDPSSRKDSIKVDDAFHLASVSKTFTAMGVLKLWQEGRLQLEDDLSKFFSDFPYQGITVKMLLNHRSGLPNYVHYFEKYGWDPQKYVSNLDVLSSLYTMHPPLQFPSGKRFAYCNTNYALLALVIEKVSGLKYASYMDLTFFKPLQMKNTYVFSLKDTARALPSYEWNNKEFNLEYLDLVYGDKNVYSTVRDMLKWDQALYAGRFFSQATLDSAFSPYSFEKRGKRNYGLGWRMTLLDNGKNYSIITGGGTGITRFSSALLMKMQPSSYSVINSTGKFIAPRNSAICLALTSKLLRMRKVSLILRTPRWEDPSKFFTAEKEKQRYAEFFS